MKNIKENKAITLIALVITIIVLLLLAGVGISMISGQDGILNKAADAKSKTEEANREEAEALEVMEAMLNGTYDGEYNKDKGVNKPKLSEGMIPVKYDETNEKWIVCSEDDAEWYNYADMKWANIMLSDGTYKAGTVTVGQEVVDSELGSMFVWIPRYAYSIVKYKTEVTTGEGTAQGITEIKFLVGNSNIDEEAERYKTDYDVDEQTETTTQMIVHPAFKFGDKNITGFWSAKFEASMAETNNNSTASTENNGTEKTVKILPNKESWRYINVGNCFTNCLEMNADGNPYGLTSTADSHLMKNNEWGAIAYLATSQYGITPTTNTNYTTYTEEGSETTKYRAYTAGGSTEGGYKNVATQSTTGNVTGIYDLNGGSWEYVAAYYANKNSYLTTYAGAYFDSSNELKEEYEKYWNRYEVSEDEIEYAKSTANLWSLDATYNAKRKEITDYRYQLMKNIKGDAMYEVMKTYSYYGKITNDSNEEVYAWLVDADDTTTAYGRSYYNNDYVLIGNCLLPFLLHGGDWWSGTGSGVFASLSYSGGSEYGSYGFRPVVVVE